MGQALKENFWVDEELSKIKIQEETKVSVSCLAQLMQGMASIGH